MDTDFGALMQVLNVGKLLYATVIIILAAVASRFISRSLERLSEGQARRRLLFKKISSISRFVIFIVATILIVTNVLTLSSEAMLALGGTLAVTAGFALKDTAASIIAGFLILIDQPFQVGDWISFGGYYGEVKEIGLRSVRVNTLDDNLVSIPTNKFLIESVASANAGELHMMVVMDFLIAVDSDFQLAKGLAYRATVTSKYVYLDRPVTVLLSDELTSVGYATRVRVKAYVVDTRFEKRFLSDVTERVKRVFRQNDIRPPFHSYRGRAPMQGAADEAGAGTNSTP